VLDSTPDRDTVVWRTDTLYAFPVTGIDSALLALNNGAVLVTNVCSLNLRDVGPFRIIRPTGLIDSGQAIVPGCSVANNGTFVESYRVRFRIGSYYDRTESVVGHQPNTRVYVTFPIHSAWPRGTHAVSCSTLLVGDQVGANNRLLDSVRVRVRDVSCHRLLRPWGTLDSGTVVTPACSVYNYGSDNASYTVRLRIGTGYNQTQTVLDHVPGTTRYLEFLNWTPQQVGAVLAETCGTELPGDARAGNDKIGTTLFIRRPGGHDVAVTRLLGPTGSTDSGTSSVPSCSLHNYGAGTETYTVRLKIGDVYNSFGSVFNHAPGTARYLTFPVWTAQQLGSLPVSCSTELATDDMQANDRQLGSVTVRRAGPDVACVAIIVPVGRVTFGSSQVPACSVANTGNAAASYWLHMRIGTGYRDSTFVSGQPVALTQAVNLPSWVPAQIGSLNVLAWTQMPGDVYGLNDSAYGACKVDSGGATGWSARAPIPEGPKGKRVKDGGSLAYNVENDTGVIYAFKGNNRCEFYRYVSEAAGWETRESIPAIGSSLKKKAVKKGGRLAQADGMIYACKGNNSLEFWEYEPGQVGRWTQKADVPSGSRTVRDGSGMAGIKVGDTTYVYLLKCSNTQEFHRYNRLSGTWQAQASAPLGPSGKQFKSGSCMTYDGGNTVYALKSAVNEFFAYDVAANTWATLANLPLTGSAGKKKVKDGAALACAGGLVFALKGGNTCEYWVYDPIAGSWNEQTSIPLGTKKVKNGGALVTAGSGIYALKGNNTLEYYYYRPDASSRPGPIRGNAAGRQTAPHDIGFSVAPNPVRGRVGVSYALPQAGPIRLGLYDVTGKLVAMLAEGRHAPGNYRIAVDHGRAAPGIYLLRLDTETGTQVAKLVVE
jgi:hypothetical protein